MKSISIVWNGIPYRRYPESKNRTHRVYFQRSCHVRYGGKTGFLHRDIWSFYNKRSVPKGYHIHHKDGNTLNNEITNLQLVTPKEHALLEKNYLKWDFKKHLDEVRPLTKKWHGSKEGKEWHIKHGKEMWKTWERIKKKCIVCGTEYETPYPSRSKYCHPNCKATALRRRRGIKPRFI